MVKNKVGKGGSADYVPDLRYPKCFPLSLYRWSGREKETELIEHFNSLPFSKIHWKLIDC